VDRWFEPEQTFVFPKQLRIRSVSTSFDGWHLTSLTFRDENAETIFQIKATNKAAVTGICQLEENEDLVGCRVTQGFW
jgi:hypothetical protein